MICHNLSVSPQGRLLFAGCDTEDLAKTFGTPLYVYDEDRIREMCRIYKEALREAFGEDSLPLYAGKAASFTHMYRILTEEGLGADVVSPGEIATAHRAGFDLSRAFYHSNNKSDGDIQYAMDHKVGYFVCDGEDEVRALDRLAAERGITQKILLRLTPGIDPHTYEAVATGKVDSKFGSAIETGQAHAITKLALSMHHLSLEGFHCHVGSQVFEEDVFWRSAQVMLEFLKSVLPSMKVEKPILDLGGGWGTRYVESDPVYDLKGCILRLGNAMAAFAKDLAIPMPRILMEPGRSLVADAGLTLYTVGSVKRIPGYKNYVSVDGGMTDNPRFALYGSDYTLYLPLKMNEPCDFLCDVVGRCCESGDVIKEKALLPASVTRGDLLAVLTTGAYHYSMASHYNRIPKPPVVMLSREKGARIVVKRETPEDMSAFDL